MRSTLLKSRNRADELKTAASETLEALVPYRNDILLLAAGRFDLLYQQRGEQFVTELLGLLAEAALFGIRADFFDLLADERFEELTEAQRQMALQVFSKSNKDENHAEDH